ncbi:MAG TPA: alpha-amylase family glycosyl hydrolase [Bacteroidales bacterium]|jgi:maltose alpha-D-glucosyltransferase/alpha-amylase|nr:alpha-glucosidase C-terminal domain-containing protein [Bacteroidales bacterium]MBP7874231.1 alpha-glucosidase C-terminal domain-containing protein [Bacteroidales bacterium]MCZ2282924.1 alpha-glucosidase C-terminal domain-containing protein [Bacteroidales bacterium]HPX33610.1 alpha-amylase family glycosyl hydrolase [Bacteroidales bacterium]HQB48475.1 alpha-amylase family glycosyl hydrolase [Bacteroidales bacterium]
MEIIKKLKSLWKQLYGNAYEHELSNFIHYIKNFKNNLNISPQPSEWYKDAIVYSLYVDLFNENFVGLRQRLDYIQKLGVNCLWLLPVLDSPMRDAGFDIRNYKKIREELLGLSPEASEEERMTVFKEFIEDAHQRNIRIIFDIAMNHTSEEHPWFVEAKKGKSNPFRDFYIWSANTDLYKDARIIFKGMETSNWEPADDEYFFHRFFSFQPDLNYRNPQVLIEMAKNLLFWLEKGVDGFRADAIPYLWKEDGTNCENLPQTHTIVKFFRATLDFVQPHTLLLAEACQKPIEVVKYFGDGDECNAGYHFPLMPQIYKALALENSEPILYTLSKQVTPEIPDNAQWFTFLRCHDELSLELVYVTEQDRALIHQNYCHDSQWDFRKGEGISARLAELMKRNPDKIALTYSIMLTLPGTPIIYYGDEYGKLNDQAYYEEQIRKTKKDDTRFLVRGKIDWETLENNLENPNSFASQVFHKISKMVNIRKDIKVLGRGQIEWLEALKPDGTKNNSLLVYIRKTNEERFLIIQNLSSSKQEGRLALQPSSTWKELFDNPLDFDQNLQTFTLKPFEYVWIRM